MKTIAFIAFLFASVTITHAQIQWRPQWVAGSKQTIEYIYSKVESMSDTLREFDSVHAMISARYIGLIDDNFFFEWKFNNFYADTMKGDASSTNKLTYELIGKTVTRCPVKFMMGKSDFAITVVNKAQIDSVADIVETEIGARVPNAKSDDRATAKIMLHMLYGLKMDDAIYSHIREYYSIYQKRDLKPNEKKDAKSEMIKQGKGRMSAGAEGYAVLEDKDPKVYRYKYDVNMDLSKMLLDLAKSLGSDDSTTKKMEKESSKNKMGVETGSETIINKSDMVVTSYYEYTNTDGSLFMPGAKETESILIRAIK